MASADPNPNLTPPAAIGKLHGGCLYRSDLDLAATQRDASAYLLAAAALDGSDRWTVDPAQLAEDLRAHPRTFARAVARLVAAGLWTDHGGRVYSRGPNLPPPSGQWVIVSERLAAILSRFGATHGGLTAFRLGLWMLPRLRAARASGRSACVLTNERLADGLGLGKSQAAAAFRLLGLAGLPSIQRKALQATEDGWRREPRALPCDCVPWTHDPAARRHDKPGPEVGQNGTAPDPDTTPQEPSNHRAHEAPAPEAEAPDGAAIGFAPDGAPGPAPLTAPLVAAGEPGRTAGQGDSGPALSAAAEILAAAGLCDPGLTVLAKVCRTADGARRFVEGEAPMLAVVANPGGWLWTAFRRYDARPGSPSQPARRRKLELDQARREDAWHERGGLTHPDGRDPLPAAAVAWYEARGVAGQIERLDRRDTWAAPGERRMLRACLRAALETLRAADLPDRHAFEVPAWEALADSADPPTVEDAAPVEVPAEVPAAEVPAAVEGGRGLGLGGPRKGGPTGAGEVSSGPVVQYAPSGPLDGAREIPSPEACRALGKGSAVAGLRLWLSRGNRAR